MDRAKNAAGAFALERGWKLWLGYWVFFPRLPLHSTPLVSEATNRPLVEKLSSQIISKQVFTLKCVYGVERKGLKTSLAEWPQLGFGKRAESWGGIAEEWGHFNLERSLFLLNFCETRCACLCVYVHPSHRGVGPSSSQPQQIVSGAACGRGSCRGKNSGVLPHPKVSAQSSPFKGKLVGGK